MDCEVTDLPQPLSPTTPRISPRCTQKLTPSMAFIMPRSVLKEVLSPCTSSIFSAIGVPP